MALRLGTAGEKEKKDKLKVSLSKEKVRATMSQEVG